MKKRSKKRSDLGLCPWDWSTRYCTYRRARPSLLDLLSEFGLISDGWLDSISPLGDWANALGCWRSQSLRLVIPVILQYFREWPTLTVIIFDMSTVVKPQQPTSGEMLARSQSNITRSVKAVAPIHKFLRGAKFFMAWGNFFLRSNVKNPV